MKAMILAAGLGTRLLPLTKKRPKPLFPVLGRPLIDILIRQLEDAGCTAVIINTHHLASMVGAFLESQNYGIPVFTRHEETILGTGGGIKNVEDFWDDAPFMVINGDIVSNIDLKQAYNFHLSQENPVTMVLHDYPKYNHVWIDAGDLVRGFGHSAPCPPGNTVPDADFRKVAYTGIQVLDPAVLSFIPEGGFHNIIDAFCEMIQEGLTIRGIVTRNHYWHDIGTMEGYQEANRELLARKAFQRAFSATESGQIAWAPLKGDGSDRKWFRVSVEGDPSGFGNPPYPPFVKGGKAEGHICPPFVKGDIGGFIKGENKGEEFSIIIVDHGPPGGEDVCEADAFAAIGKHLHEKGVPVPLILAYDRPSGLVALEDLGDLHLQQVVRGARDVDDVMGSYRKVIDGLVVMAVEGAKGFDLQVAYQTPHYDRDLILDKEARYFVEAFLNGHLNLAIDFESLEDDFRVLAEKAVEQPYTGFLHRDFQSRNILVKDGSCYFIDFQGGRFGPLQYDLASLLIDPYVTLPEDLQAKLLDYYVEQLSRLMPVNHHLFADAYQYCAINRNLQILGAFAFLSGEKGKRDFEAYIPAALSSLKTRMGRLGPGMCQKLRRLVASF
jgi:NDP-sugar pyrophosphorylase family protein/aminoglycoside/choline kinase family phosphotransferase